jgi:hypothetical protein
MSRGFVTFARRRSTSALSSIYGGKERNASCQPQAQTALFIGCSKQVAALRRAEQFMT